MDTSTISRAVAADIEGWRSRNPSRPDTAPEAAAWLLSRDDEADRGFVDALFDTTIDRTAFGDSRLVAPRAAFGPLASLRTIVNKLVTEQPWTVGDATMFVISGHVPPTSATRRVDLPVAETPRRTVGRRPSPVQRLLVDFLESDPPGATWTAWAEAFTVRHPDHPKERTNMRRDCERAWTRLRPTGPDMPQPVDR